MEYTRSIGDVYETFEGTPDEIAELLTSEPRIVEWQVEQINEVDEDKLLDYIEGHLFIYDMRVDRKAIAKILELELDYLAEKGIAE